MYLNILYKGVSGFARHSYYAFAFTFKLKLVGGLKRTEKISKKVTKWSVNLTRRFWFRIENKWKQKCDYYWLVGRRLSVRWDAARALAYRLSNFPPISGCSNFENFRPEIETIDSKWNKKVWTSNARRLNSRVMSGRGSAWFWWFFSVTGQLDSNKVFFLLVFDWCFSFF